MSGPAVYPSYFRPRATGDLVRLGGPNDGGYVLPARVLSHSTGLLSFGLNDDCTFERDFAARAGCPVVCFDHTVDAKFWWVRTANSFAKGVLRLEPRHLVYAGRWLAYRRMFDGRRHRHVRKAIGYGGDGSVTFHDAVRLAGFTGPFFAKIDIEGWEYRVLDDLIAGADRMTGLALELHDIDLHTARIRAFLEQMTRHMELVHFHTNTAMLVGPQGTSIVAELTFLSKGLLEPSEQLSARPLPIAGLDASNVASETETPIEFEASPLQ